MLIRSDTEMEELNNLETDGEVVLPNFFLNHIQQLKLMNGIKRQEKPQTYEEYEEQLNHKLESISKQRLFGILNKFYAKMIVQKGFKKCQCLQCKYKMYPFLIKFDENSELFYEKHQFMTNYIQEDLSKRDQIEPVKATVYLEYIFI